MNFVDENSISAHFDVVLTKSVRNVYFSRIWITFYSTLLENARREKITDCQASIPGRPDHQIDHRNRCIQWCILSIPFVVFVSMSIWRRNERQLSTIHTIAHESQLIVFFPLFRLLLSGISEFFIKIKLNALARCTTLCSYLHTQNFLCSLLIDRWSNVWKYGQGETEFVMANFDSSRLKLCYCCGRKENESSRAATFRSRTRDLAKYLRCEVHCKNQ